MSSADILTVDALNVSYGDSKALFDVSLRVAPREVVGCVGRNGAGKSTLLKCIGGFLKPASGAIVSGSTDLVGLAGFVIARLGVKYVPQDKKVFSDLTVRENLELGSYATKDYNWDQVTGYFPKLKQLMDRKAGYLSGGERQMLATARALMARPRLLMLDEPSLGLAPKIVETILAIIQEVNRRGVAVLLVEQNAQLALKTASRAYLLENGTVVKSGATAEFLADESVRRSYLGI